jgi:hypothetical protein
MMAETREWRGVYIGGVMTFEAWLKKNEADLYEMGTVEEIATAAWQAAQQVEREREARLVMEMHGLEAANLLRKINEPT